MSPPNARPERVFLCLGRFAANEIPMTLSPETLLKRRVAALERKEEKRLSDERRKQKRLDQEERYLQRRNEWLETTSAPYRYLGGNTTGERIVCLTCGHFFNSRYAYGSHLREDRCRTREEMLDAGMKVNKDGFWVGNPDKFPRFLNARR